MGRKPVERPANPVDGGPMLKMKELVEATGISKATILYYLSERLLPEPVKTSPNVSYYPSSTIERIHLIRELQSRHRFSLAQIRSILKGREMGPDLESLIEFNKEVFVQEEGKTVSRKEFCKSSGLSEEQLQLAMDLKLVIPNAEGSFDNADLSAGRFLKGGLELGVDIEDFSFYAHKAEEIVDQELSMRKQFISGMSYDEAMTVTLRMTNNARFFRQYVIERIFKQRGLKQPLKVDPR